MLGAIIGDIVGSRFEWHNHKSKSFDFFSPLCFFTDDTVMTLAVAKAILTERNEMDALQTAAVRCMREVGQPYPHCGYGGHFLQWVYTDDPKPYDSYGNGAAMRVSACGFAGASLEDVIALSHAVTCVTHNHPEGLKGAEATAVAIFLARSGKTISEIREYLTERYYPLAFTLREIAATYSSTKRAKTPCRRRSKRSWNPTASRTPSETPSPSAATATRWRRLRAVLPKRTMAFPMTCAVPR